MSLKFKPLVQNISNPLILEKTACNYASRSLFRQASLPKNAGIIHFVFRGWFVVSEKGWEDCTCNTLVFFFIKCANQKE
jgi:hypothetical protein